MFCVNVVECVAVYGPVNSRLSILCVVLFVCRCSVHGICAQHLFLLQGSAGSAGTDVLMFRGREC